MRASPALQVTLTAFGVWRAGVLVLAGVAAAMPWAWTAAQADVPPGWVMVVMAALSATAVAFGVQSARIPACSLRWDGQRWHVGAPASAGDEPQHGTLDVAIDLGAWMLLCFVPELPRGRHRVAVWLPVQRRGLESRWHALRCAVYTPRPVAPGQSGSTTA